MAEILGRERRRRWSDAEKAEIVAESFRPGVSVSWIARRRGVSASQLFNWRKAARGEDFASSRTPDLIPVVVGASAPAVTPRAEADDCMTVVAAAAVSEARIEIAFPNGRRLMAPAGLDRRLLDPLIQSVARG